MARFLSLVLFSAACFAPAMAEANPYAAYVAKYLGEYMLGKALDEAWDAATGAPDVKELDMRLRAFEDALSQVDARLSNRIGELRRRIDQRPTRDEVRQIVLQVLGELESRIAELERRADRIEQKIAQFEEVFGIVTTVPPAPLIRSSVEAGNPAVHPLTAEWARLLCECETSRLKIHKLRQTLADDHPDVIVAEKADQEILKRIAACHAKVLEESVKRIDERMDLLRTERLKPTHPKVRLVDDSLASLLWLRAVSNPLEAGPQKGRLSLPKDMIGPKCSEILAAFRLANADVKVLAPLFRHLLAVPLEQTSLGVGTIPEDLSEHVANTRRYLGGMSQLCRESKQLDARLQTERREHSDLHEAVVSLLKQQRTLVTRIQRAHEVTEAALSAALAAYLEKLQYERPTNANMFAFRVEVLLPLNELAELTTCSDWDNRLTVQETWERVLGWNSFTNSLGMELVRIPAGPFEMGAPKGEDEALDDEKPQHKVLISQAFYMGATEVTQGQYEEVMGWNLSEFKHSPHQPVENVTWENAIDFCRKLSEKEGRTYRLPTEAEWEYACRAGTKTKWCSGDGESGLKGYAHAWYDELSDNKTHPVAQKKANAWGLYDMHGNVEEWCADWRQHAYYGNSPSVDPRGPPIGGSRVCRGGSWSCRPTGSRSSHRSDHEPSTRGNWLGFRVVASRSPR